MVLILAFHQINGDATAAAALDMASSRFSFSSQPASSLRRLSLLKGRGCRFYSRSSKSSGPVRYIPKVKTLRDPGKSSPLQIQVEKLPVTEKNRSLSVDHERQTGVFFSQQESEKMGSVSSTRYKDVQEANEEPFSSGFSKNQEGFVDSRLVIYMETGLFSNDEQFTSPVEQRFCSKASESQKADRQRSLSHPAITGKVNIGVEGPCTTADDTTDSKGPSANDGLISESKDIFHARDDTSIKADKFSHIEGLFMRHARDDISVRADEISNVEGISKKAHRQRLFSHTAITEKLKIGVEGPCTIADDTTDSKGPSANDVLIETNYISRPSDDRSVEADDVSHVEDILATKDASDDISFKADGFSHVAVEFSRLEDILLTDDEEAIHDTYNIFCEPHDGEELHLSPMWDNTDSLPEVSQPTGTSRLQDAESNSYAARVAAKNQALKYLAMRPLTTAELRKKLGKKKLSSKLIDSAIADLQSCGLQSDLDYAETYAQSRWNVQTWGPQRIKHALKCRGVTEKNINTALERVFKNQDDRDEDDALAMSKSAREQLVKQATKQWSRGKNVSDDARVQRIIRWLQYRGFDWKVIKYVLKLLPGKSEAEST